MKLGLLFPVAAIIAIIGSVAIGQTLPSHPSATPLPRISELLKKNIEQTSFGPISRERREIAYAKLLEGQRLLWRTGRLRSQAGISNTAKLARQSFQEAAEHDPKLAEAYTALAELALNIQPGDPDEAINLAELASQIAPDNFGSRRIKARLYTYKSKLTSDQFDSTFATKAIVEWGHVTKLDPRNAEAWAFLAALYEKTDRLDEHINALRNWSAASAPTDTQFYSRLMGTRDAPTPESASAKLGPALLKSGRTKEAVEVLSDVIAADPDNEEAVDHMKEALEKAREGNSTSVVEPLERAASANPDNLSLISLLADSHRNAGRFDRAAEVLLQASTRMSSTNKEAAATLHITLGDLFFRAQRPSDSVKAYEDSLRLRGIEENTAVSDDSREFAMFVFEKMMQVLKSVNRLNDAKAVIERSRQLFGENELFADRHLISLYREMGDRRGALDVVKDVRKRFPNDYGFIRLEATLLSESGRVDEAVGLIRKLIDSKQQLKRSAPSPSDASVTVAVPAYDDFSNYLFISNLYSSGNRGKEAADAANQAYAVARGAERKQIARLTLATAQQMAKDFAGAEATLREILRESPGNPIALNNLGYFLIERDERLVEALALIKQAVKVDPTNPSYLDSLGWANFKLGKLDEAEIQLKEAARLNSGSATIQEHLGDVLEKKGDSAAALAAWNKALLLASDPEDVKRLKLKIQRRQK